MPAKPGLRAAIIGCGLIGKKRVAALSSGQVSVVCDINLAAAEALAKTAGCVAVRDVEAAVSRADVDWVVVATTNQVLAKVAKSAVAAGKHVLVQKPGGISSAELREVHALAEEQKVLVRVGFNHRYHRALRKARELFDSGALGPLMFIRGRYGHGGRKGYDREWRADPALSGGGELIDQGVHLIDLAGWFLGRFTHVDGFAATYFWDMPVDDNAFLALRNADDRMAWLQVSCTEWKNMFSLEIYGRDAKLQIDGLGGSYGVERLAYYKMLPEMGPPDTTIFEYAQGDDSWRAEIDDFLGDIRAARRPNPGLPEAIEALTIVEEIYRRSGFPKPGIVTPHRT